MDFLFKDLIVWQKAMELTKMVYALIRRFPVEERYALGDQLRRAVVSIPSNIAEGNGRAESKMQNTTVHLDLLSPPLI